MDQSREVYNLALQSESGQQLAASIGVVFQQYLTEGRSTMQDNTEVKEKVSDDKEPGDCMVEETGILGRLSAAAAMTKSVAAMDEEQEAIEVEQSKVLTPHKDI